MAFGGTGRSLDILFAPGGLAQLPQRWMTAWSPVPECAMGPRGATDVHVGRRAVPPLNGLSAPKIGRTQFVFLQAAQDKCEEEFSPIFIVDGRRHHGASFCTGFY